MKSKKDIPLIIHKKLQKFVSNNGEKFIIDINTKDCIIKLKDIDSNSDFYFIIESFRLSNNRNPANHQVQLDIKPYSETYHEGIKTWCNINDLERRLDIWINLLDEYNKIVSFFDDPILKSFTESYYTEFKFDDENANLEPLNPNKIILLVDCLNKVNLKLDDYVDENNKLQIENIKEDIEEIKNKVTVKSKNWVMKKVSIILAKISKLGPNFIKFISSEAGKTIVNEITKKAIDGFIN